MNGSGWVGLKVNDLDSLSSIVYKNISPQLGKLLFSFLLILSIEAP